jgi:ferredoxin
MMGNPAWIERQTLDALFRSLARRGYETVGPAVRDGAIVYEPIGSAAELPEGWTDEQEGGRYRLKRRADRALFGYVVGPQSWKKLLFPSQLRLWRLRRTDGGYEAEAEPAEAPRYALVGVRSCEIAALRVQDRVFLGGPVKDPVYAARRENLFVVAVQCGQAGGTCFCVSMGTGPRADQGFDLALTEVIEPARHGFVVETGSERGREVLNELEHRDVTADERAAASAATERAAGQMGRQLDTRDLPRRLRAQPEHPRWEEVAKRCLTCANCTLVCPTCFCHTVEDQTDLTGEHAERWRKWDSCFSQEFSYLHGGSVRVSARSRYRQWLTHKLSTWVDQFGELGCVGCGRCITWCPVGIDLTEEARAIAGGEPA